MVACGPSATTGGVHKPAGHRWPAVPVQRQAPALDGASSGQGRGWTDSQTELGYVWVAPD